jgi:hypothetical protein
MDAMNPDSHLHSLILQFSVNSDALITTATTPRCSQPLKGVCPFYSLSRFHSRSRNPEPFKVIFNIVEVSLPGPAGASPAFRFSFENLLDTSRVFHSFYMPNPSQSVSLYFISLPSYFLEGHDSYLILCQLFLKFNKSTNPMQAQYIPTCQS